MSDIRHLYESGEGEYRAQFLANKDIWLSQVPGQSIPRGTRVQLWLPSVTSYDRIQRKWFGSHDWMLIKLPIEFITHWITIGELANTGQFEEIEDSELGQGAFGRVVRVSNSMTPGIEYAKKIMTIPETDLDDSGVFNEIYAMHAFRNDFHVADLVRVLQEDEKRAIIMLPIANRGDLGKVLKSLRQQPLMSVIFKEGRLQIFRWIYCLVKTLTRIHEKRVTHGDIKIENVLVHNNTIIYSDFGIAYARRHSTMPGITSTGSTAKSSPVPPSAIKKSATNECQCQCKLEQLLETDNSAPPLGSSETGLGKAKGDVFSLGWIIYDMLLVATPSPLLGTTLPCRSTAQPLAWYDKGKFVELIEDVSEDAQKASCILGPEHARYAGLTKDLLDIVTRHMIVPRADERDDSYDVAARIKIVMERWNFSSDGCVIAQKSPAEPWWDDMFC
ncbi:kinase-like domain-containing protein [Hyaloscypha sp. PMI_1271]|nr:kinase-like domain-containing protein [Hyaloscypha sp. PMI_1271]